MSDHHPAGPSRSGNDSYASGAAAAPHPHPSSGRTTPVSGVGAHFRPPTPVSGRVGSLQHLQANGQTAAAQAGTQSHVPHSEARPMEEDADNPLPSDDSSPSSLQHEVGGSGGELKGPVIMQQASPYLPTQQPSPNFTPQSIQQAAPPLQPPSRMPTPLDPPEADSQPQNGRRVPSARIAKRPTTLKALQGSSEEEEEEDDVLPKNPAPNLKSALGPAQGLLQQHAHSRGLKRGPESGHPLAGYPLQQQPAAVGWSSSSMGGDAPYGNHVPKRRRMQKTRKTSRLAAITAMVQSFAQGPPPPPCNPLRQPI